MSPLSFLVRHALIHFIVPGIKAGRLVVEIPGRESIEFGPRNAVRTGRIRIHDEAEFLSRIRGGEIGFGEAYMDGL